MTNPTEPSANRTRWAAIPAARSSAATLKIKVRLIFGALIFAALLGPLSLLLVASASDEVEVAQSESTALAASVAADFLAGRPTRQPVAEGVDARFGVPEDEETDPLDATTPVHVSSTPVQVDDTTTVFIHRFSTLIEGEPMIVEVVTRASDSGQPVLAALPTLAPAGVAGEARQTRLPGTTTGIAAEVDERINEWLRAYADDESAALQELAGDTDADAVYRGLGGFRAGTYELVEATSTEDGSVLARIRVLFTRTGPEEWSQLLEFDLLITDPASGLPRIAAWGPAGSGPTLTAGANNLTRPTSTETPEQ